MEIRNLLSFVQVAELNSFTRAAAALGYSQSTVSFQIKQLEEELGCLLFERVNHTITLTEKGAELLEFAQRISRMTEEFNQSLNEGKPMEGHIRILAPSSVCEEMMLKNYMELHKSYPGISLKFTSADTYDMFGMLDKNEADLMLTLDTHIYKRDYVIAKEEPVSMHFVTGRGSVYDTGRAVTLSELSEMPFLLTEKNAGYRRSLDAALAERSLEIVPILELERTDIITEMLSRGAGVSFLPDFVTERGVREGQLVYLDVPEAQFDIWKQLIYHKNKWLSRTLSALIEFIKEHEFGAEGGKNNSKNKK